MTTSAPLSFSDPSPWHLVNTDWDETQSDTFVLTGDRCGTPGAAMQGMHYAVHPALCCVDCAFEFEIRLNPHSDTGVVFRARDASHFYLLHFPNCGQQSRAQHFWVALSRMDDSGYLRRMRMSLVNGVPSTRKDIWLHVRAHVEGPRVTVKVGDYGHVAFEDATYRGPGHVGVYAWRDAALRGLRVATPRQLDPIWEQGPVQRVNWTIPAPMEERVWQQPIDVRRFHDGEMVMQANLQKVITAGSDAVAFPYLMRSSDRGRSWSPPKEIDFMGDGNSWSPPRLHLTPNERLLLVTPGRDHKKVFESTDRGNTWSDAGTTNLHIGPPRDQPVQDLSPAGFLNLRDGSILAIMLSSALIEASQTNHTVWTWGSVHCQAFAARSEDDGRTWSEPVNVDASFLDADGNVVTGNMDLTEGSAFETADGRVVMLIRPVYSPWMWQTWSDDGGRSWSPCVRGPFPGYAAPNMVRTVSGAVLIAHRMPGLCVHCSRDDGRTWDEGTTIDSSVWAMGSMVEVEPDVVLYIYWDSDYSLMRSQRIRVTPSEIEPG